MENYRLIIAVFLVGTFVSVNSLQCYVCNDCASNLSDDQLKSCSAEDTNTTTTTTLAPPDSNSTTGNNSTETGNSTQNIYIDPENPILSIIDAIGSAETRSITSYADTVKYVCAKSTMKVNETDTVVRACVPAQVEGKEFCSYVATFNVTNCKTCDTDKCNSAFSLQSSIVCLLMIVSLALFK